MLDRVVVSKANFELNSVLSALFLGGRGPFIDSGDTSRSYVSFCWFEPDATGGRLLHGVEVFGLSEKELQRVRGQHIQLCPPFHRMKSARRSWMLHGDSSFQPSIAALLRLNKRSRLHPSRDTP